MSTERLSILRRLRGLGFGVLTGFVTVSTTHAVESESFAAPPCRFWFRSEIKLDRLPGIAAFRLQTQAGRRFIPAVHHAILATRIARHAVNHAVFLPLHLLQQFGVARIMRVGHQIARAFPTANVSGRNRPSRTGQIAMTCKKLKENWLPTKYLTPHPPLTLTQLLHRHFSRS